MFIDMGFHLFPAIFLLADSIFLTPPVAMKRERVLAIFGVVIALYCVWVTICFRVNGYWVYPVIEALGFVERLGVFASWVILNWLVWLTIERLKIRTYNSRHKKITRV